MFFLLLFLILVMPIHARAETTIELTLIGNYFDGENNLEVDITTEDAAEFKVRPRIDPPQTLFIYDGPRIFSLGSFWTDIPAMPSHLTLHTPVPFQAADLWFEVQDTKTGKTYETPKKQVFSHTFVESYISDLNRRIFGQ